MEKLKKLFPLSFKFCNGIGGLILCALLYSLIYIAATLVVGLIVIPIISLILGILLSPLFLIGLVIVVIGCMLCYTVIGAIIGIPLVLIGVLLMYAGSIITGLIQGIILNMIWLYVTAGFVVAILAYSGLGGES